jgi:hypothetical protein
VWNGKRTSCGIIDRVASGTVFRRKWWLKEQGTFAEAKVRETARESATREENNRLRAVRDNAPVNLGSQRHFGKMKVSGGATL